MTLMENSSLTELLSEIVHLKHKLVEKDSQLVEKDSQLVKTDTRVSYLEEQLAWFKRQLFGKRSERTANDLNKEQLTLEGFNIPKLPDQETKEVPAHTRRKPRRDGKDKITLSPDLPVKTTILDIPEEQKVCQETGESLVQIGVEITHKIAHQPGSYYIKEIIRPKYAHPQREEQGILTADLPDSFLPKCRADESLLAEIISKKFADHLPLYRIAEILEREGVKISRRLLSQWVIHCGRAFKPLYSEMVKKVIGSENLFIDESPIKLWEKVKCRTGYMWVLVGGDGSDPPYKVYDFRINRCHDNVWDILEGYQKILHSDKDGAYQRLAEKKVITWCPCWAHVRRKFFESESGDVIFRDWVLRKIRYLFMLERVAWKRSPEERLKIREEKEVPIIDALIHRIKEKLIDGKCLPKSKLRTAIGYFCSLIPYLKNYIYHPFSKLDNNVAERAIRPLAIGRKNWLFFGSKEGGEAEAVLLSLVQTCRGLGINPREYLEDVMRKLMSHKMSTLYELLPDEWLKRRSLQSVD